MNYKIEDIEDQLIATLKADVNLYPSCTIDVHAGDAIAQMFSNAALMEGIIAKLPFILVQYQGKQTTEMDESASLYKHALKFRFYVGTESLRRTKESQRSAYALLRSIYDDIHGRIPNASATAGSPLPKFTGVQIADAAFNGWAPTIEAGGSDERLIVNLPRIVVYQTDYTLELQA